MSDLIHTVRQRYEHSVSYRGFSTLTHPAKPAVAEPPKPEPKKGGLLDFFRPQLSGISSMIRAEIAKLLARREKAVLQTVGRDMPILIDKHTRQWKAESVRAEKTHIETVKRTEKRIDLVAANANSTLKTMRRELDALKEREKRNMREKEREMRENPPLSHRAAKRVADETVKRERADLRREMELHAVKMERRVERKRREREEYEKRRRG